MRCAHLIGHIGEIQQVDALFGVPALGAFDMLRGFVPPGTHDVADAGAAIITGDGLKDFLPFFAPVLKGIEQRRWAAAIAIGAALVDGFSLIVGCLDGFLRQKMAGEGEGTKKQQQDPHTRKHKRRDRNSKL